MVLVVSLGANFWIPLQQYFSCFLLKVPVYHVADTSGEGFVFGENMEDRVIKVGSV